MHAIRPILFLDYDGVLHPDRAVLRRGRPALAGGGHLFMWAGLLEPLVAAHPALRIVLSTSWARELGFSRARRYLPVTLQARVIGATWHSGMADGGGRRRMERDTWWDMHTRYQQIRRYVQRDALQHWLALDDHPEGWATADAAHLLQTDSDKGISCPLIQSELAARLQQLVQAAADSQAALTGVLTTKAAPSYP